MPSATLSPWSSLHSVGPFFLFNINHILISTLAEGGGSRRRGRGTGERATSAKFPCSQHPSAPAGCRSDWGHRRKWEEKEGLWKLDLARGEGEEDDQMFLRFCPLPPLLRAWWEGERTGIKGFLSLLRGGWTWGGMIFSLSPPLLLASQPFVILFSSFALASSRPLGSSVCGCVCARPVISLLH